MTWKVMQMMLLICVWLKKGSKKNQIIGATKRAATSSPSFPPRCLEILFQEEGNDEDVKKDPFLKEDCALLDYKTIHGQFIFFGRYCFLCEQWANMAGTLKRTKFMFHKWYNNQIQIPQLCHPFYGTLKKSCEGSCSIATSQKPFKVDSNSSSTTATAASTTSRTGHTT